MKYVKGIHDLHNKVAENIESCSLSIVHYIHRYNNLSLPLRVIYSRSGESAHEVRLNVPREEVRRSVLDVKSRIMLVRRHPAQHHT